ncbi:hypothetical protein ACFWJW_27300 [Streptomyces sp. NPDC127097]|uniref:hypothetical protein n=1 Tax=Streptomyces sp. NPDC127097 TaxID=3347136 RepID=UPI0036632A4E
MEEPTSGPEPEAPAQAAPGEPMEPAEPREPGPRERSGAVSPEGGLPAGPVGSGSAAGPDGAAGRDVPAERGVAAEPDSDAEPGGGAERSGDAEPDSDAEPGGGTEPGDTAEPVGAAGPGGQGRSGAAGEPVEPAGPQPIGVGVTPTGEAAVDTGLRRLADADHLPASEHLQVYEDVHRGLRDVLAGLDQHPGPPAPSSTTHDNRS